MKKFFVTGLLALLVVFIIYSGPFFDIKLAISSAVGQLFGLAAGGASNLKERIASLEMENQYLRSQLQGKGNGGGEQSIKVYSSYPFNSRDEIAIAAGANHGIEPGDAVVHAGNILVGRVRNVFKSSSVVTTIFDPSWEVPVRIGEGEVDALMQGGNELKLVLISQDKHIEEGDLVVVASENLPYGLELGFVGIIESVPGGVFKEATLEPSLQLKELRDVSIYR